MISLSKKALSTIIIAIVFFFALAFLVLNENGLLKYLKTRNELNSLDAEIRKTEDKIKSAEMEIDSLKTSKVKIEKVAREKFHMMKKSEKVFKIEEN
jgi:cell division protein FtsB